MELLIKVILKKKRMSAERLGELIGVSRRAMFYKLSKDGFTFIELKRISKALDCSIYELIKPEIGFDFIFYDDDNKFRGVVKKLGK